MLLDKSGEILDDVVILDWQDTADFNTSNILPQPEAVIADIQAWLNPTQYADDGSEYQKHLSSHLKGTGQWVIDSPIFQKWRDGDDYGVLWIRGIPGAGKSVHAATLIEHLSRNGCPVLYFFFRHTVEANHQPQAALRDWLSQALAFSPPLQLELKGQLTTSIDTLSLADLSKLLRLALAHIPRAYCVVDALDEMDQTALEPFLRTIDNLGHWRPREVKIIMTSRPVAVVERIVRNLRLLDVRLDKNLVEPDITVYLWHRLSQSCVPPKSHAWVVEYILSKADGLFLYAKLAMDAISHIDDDTKFQETLHGLPVDLTVMYSNLLQEHLHRTGISPDIQVMVLQCVTHAVRPLRLLEISDCIAVTQPQHGQDRGVLKDLVRKVCGPLLEILPDETVRVVHHSLTEYLLGLTRPIDATTASLIIFDPGQTHFRMAMLCLSYLQSCGLEQVKIKHHLYHGDRVDKKIYTPFTKYTLKNWHAHIKKAATLGHDLREINDLLYKLLVEGHPDNTRKLGVFSGTMSKGGQSSGKQPKPEAAALRLGIALDLVSFVESLLDRFGDEIANYDADIDYSPLIMAVGRGNRAITEVLIRHGADVNQYDTHGSTPLHTSLGFGGGWKGKPELADILLKAGADPLKNIGENKHVMNNTIGSSSPTPAIMYAFKDGDPKIAAVFMPYVKSAKQANRALGWAINGKRDAAVIAEILRHPKVDINAKQGNGRGWSAMTPLYAACAVRDSSLIRSLLAAGADPNIPHDWTHGAREGEDSKTLGYNVLHSLANHGDVSFLPTSSKDINEEETRECFRLVLEAGANLQQVDCSKTTPLHVARDKFAARCLIEAGADITAENEDGETILHLIHDADLLETLLESFDINSQCPETGQTLLIRTLKDRHYNWINGVSNDQRLEKALKLIDLGADVNLTDKKVRGYIGGRSALHYAAQLEGIDLPKLQLLWQKLIDAGADPNLQDEDGQTPLHRFSFANHGKITRKEFDPFLKITRPDVNIRDKQGRTPLFHLVDYQRYYDTKNILDLIKFLEEAGATFNTTDLRGRTLLHAAARHCRDNTQHMQYLVDKGVDPNQPDIDGNTIWHEAIPTFSQRQVSPDVFRGFTALGADLSAKNKLGRTPLHVLCEYLEWAGESRNWEEKDDPVLSDYILDQKPALLNQKDNQGIIPLHFASTFSAQLVERLLDRGVDAGMTTAEGLNALHLAARSRQSNIVGVVISWLQSKGDQQYLSQVLDARDTLGRTVLYYACASGRVESVQLLIGAGASVDTESYKGSAWNGCADFEQEIRDADWSRSSDDYGARDKSPAGGVLIADQTRPRRAKGSSSSYSGWGSFPPERIDEILELLVMQGPTSGRKFLAEAIQSTIEQQFEYSTACLAHARESLGIVEALTCEEKVRECIVKREAASLSPPNSTWDLFGLAMKIRHFEAAMKASSDILLTELYKDNRNGEGILLNLTHAGYASLLDAVLTPEVMAALGSVQKLENLNKTNPEDKNSSESSKEQSHEVHVAMKDFKKDEANVVSEQRFARLLHTTCQTERPNMNVLRVLVEKKKINVNARLNPKRHWGTTALHAIVDGGRLHWWQFHDALPYLLRNGADTEARNSSNMTPLHLCLERLGKPSFSKKTVQTLLDAGADPSAVDSRERSCLSMATGNTAVCKMLLAYSPKVTPSELSSAIKCMNLELVNLMLSSGHVDVNLRKPGKEIPRQTSENGRSITPETHDPNGLDELYPIDLVVCGLGRDAKSDKGIRMFNLLLEHGANLAARYEKTTVVHRMMRNMGESMDISYSGENPFLMRIVEHPSLDFEVRDADGLTVLLIACDAGKMQAVKALLDRGADFRARDNKNQNMLHLLLRRKNRRGFGSSTMSADALALRKKLIPRVISLAPDLLNEVDDDGRTPLHCTLHRDSLILEDIEALLTAGADVNAINTETGDTPLHLLLGGLWHVVLDKNNTGSVQGDRKILLDRFLSLGADINARNKSGETPIFLYFRKGGVMVSLPKPKEEEDDNDDDNGSSRELKHCSERYRKRNEAHRKREGEMAVEKEPEVWALFDQVGVNWMAVSQSRRTLLHVVAADDSREGRNYKYRAGRRVARFRFLLSKEIDVLAEDEKHQTALDIAAALGVEDVLEIFKSKD